MRFSEIVGFQQIKKAFVSMVDEGRVPHAIMLYENDGGGALPLALGLIQYMACERPSGVDSCGECRSCGQNGKLIWPDVHFTFPITTGTLVSGLVKDLTCRDYAEPWRKLVLENPFFLESQLPQALGFEKKQGVIAVAEGASILRDLSISTVTGGWRTVVMWLPEKMNVQTSNMLLKAIEEPAPKTLFLLITHSPESVLPTISSRCLGIRVPPLSKEEVAQTLVVRKGVTMEEALAAAAYAGGSVGAALAQLSDKDELSEERGLFESLMMALLGRDLYSALDAADAAAALPSRERQRQFCSYSVGCLRKVFLVQQGLEGLAGLTSDEGEFVRRCAAGLKKSFCRKAMDAFDNAARMVGRNVSQKIVFTNLADQLFLAM